MKSRIIPVLLTTLGLLSSEILNAHSEPSATVGVIVGTTGLAAAAGTSVKNSIDLADREHDKQNQVRFIFEDDGFQAKNAVSAADKLISRDKVDALITFSGTTSLAVSQVAARRRVPMVAVTALSDVSAGRDLIRTIYIPPQRLAWMMSDLVSRLGCSRVAIITSSQDALLALKKALRVSLTGNPERVGVAPSKTIVFDDEIVPGDVELFSLVTRLINRGPEVVIALTLPPQGANIAKLLRSQRYSGHLLVGPPTYNFSEISGANGSLAGALLVGPRSGLRDSFFMRYRNEFKEPSVAEGMYGYDAATFVIQAVKSGDIRRFLNESKNLNGLAGTYPLSADNLFEVPAEMKMITKEGDVVTYLAGR